MTSSKQDRIAALPAHLREELRRRMAGAAARPDRIPAADRSRTLPLSFAQQRLWFLDQLRPGGAEYNSAFALRLTGPLDVQALAEALRLLVARHESLRTTFGEVDGAGVQLVHPPYDVPLPLVDVSPDGLDEVLRTEYSRPFDLRRGPLVRAMLARLGRAEHVLLVSMHHIVTDGWSMGVLTEELSVLYEQGTAAVLPPQPLQYADFAAWQRNQAELDDQLGYWERHLAEVTPLQLPLDRPRPTVRSAAGAAREFTVPAGVAAGLRELARTSETTLFTVLLTACQVLFARYAGQADVTLGTAVSGRSRPELERVVGFFVNTLAIRSTVDTSASFAELLGGTRQAVLDAFAHQDVPFEQVVDVVHAERSAARNPLFDVMVLLQNTPATKPAFRQWRIWK